MQARGTAVYRAVSPYRRLVADMMQFAVAVPCATVERRMGLSALVAARRACAPPPSWSALFVKAYALVAARTPALRTSYLKFPWPLLYEHPYSVATISVEREVAGERIVLQAHIPHPETLPLSDLDATVRDWQVRPVEAIPSYRTAVWLSLVPWPLRQALWWGALNVFGSIRSYHFGTFSTTSVGAEGAGVLHVPTPLTSTLHYGTFGAEGDLAVRLTFDHRVLDGAAAARALADLEGALLGEVLQECASQGGGAGGPAPVG
jgi:hypothetical protein